MDGACLSNRAHRRKETMISKRRGTARSSGRLSRRRWGGPCFLALWLAMVIPIVIMLIPPSSPPPPSPIELPRIEARIETLKKEVTAITEDAKAGKPHPFLLRMTEKEINTYLASNRQAQEILSEKNITRAFVRIQDGRVHAT